MPLKLHPDRFFPAGEETRAIARSLFARVEKLPIISPHGHTDPKWFASDAPFEDVTGLLFWPDHYTLRMAYSQGITLQAMGLHDPSADRRAFQIFPLAGAGAFDVEIFEDNGETKAYGNGQFRLGHVGVVGMDRTIDIAVAAQENSAAVPCDA